MVAGKALARSPGLSLDVVSAFLAGGQFLKSSFHLSHRQPLSSPPHPSPNISQNAEEVSL
jgi:hypothetical protein